VAATPQTRYARSGDLYIAYQVVGDGPQDLVFVHGWISHIEHVWEEPSLARFFGRLGSFTRLILLDKRGTGMSDPVPLDRLPTLEERMDDVRAVMDAAGPESATLFGTSEAGALNRLARDTHPRRTAPPIPSAGQSTAAISLSASRARATSSSRARTICYSPRTPTASWPRCANSSPASARSARASVCWPRSSSPTSWTRRRALPRWA